MKLKFPSEKKNEGRQAVKRIDQLRVEFFPQILLKFGLVGALFFVHMRPRLE